MISRAVVMSASTSVHSTCWRSTVNKAHAHRGDSLRPSALRCILVSLLHSTLLFRPSPWIIRGPPDISFTHPILPYCLNTIFSFTQARLPLLTTNCVSSCILRPAVMSSPLDEQYVRDHFRPLCASYDVRTFFQRWSPTVDCRVMGSHALSGHYHTLTDFQARFARMSPRMEGPITLDLTSLIVSGHQAVVELLAHCTQKNGDPYPQTHCWILRYNVEGIVDQARLYMDGVLIDQTIKNNPGP